MMRNESQRYGETAEDRFRGLISGKYFVPNSRERDYGIDHDVEVFLDGEITEFFFHVQVKKCGKPYKRRRAFVRVQIKMKHLRQYLTKVLLPVFLIGVDLDTGKGYWLFAQQYASEMKPKDFEKPKGTITVQIPKRNSLDDYEALLEAVKDAHKFMKKQHPGEPQDAVIKSEEEMKALDPRFEYQMIADRDTTRVTCTALQDIAIGFSFKGREETRSKFMRMIEQGMPTEFTKDELGIYGLPILEHRMEFTERLRIDPSKKIDVTLQVSTVDRDKVEIRQIGTFRGWLKGGIKLLRLESESKEHPFALLLDIDRLASTGKSHHFPFHGDNWLGQNLLNLSYFTELWNLYTDLKNGGSMKVRCSSDYGVIFDATAMVNEEIVEGIYFFLDILYKARSLSTRFGINPNLTAQDEDQMILIGTLFELLSGRKLKPGRITVSVSARKGDLKKAGLMKKQVREDLIVGFPPVINFMGYDVALGIESLKYTKATQVTDVRQLPDFKTMKKNDLVPVEFQLSEDSEITAELAD